MPVFNTQQFLMQTHCGLFLKSIVVQCPALVVTTLRFVLLISCFHLYVFFSLQLNNNKSPHVISSVTLELSEL